MFGLRRWPRERRALDQLHPVPSRDLQRRIWEIADAKNDVRGVLPGQVCKGEVVSLHGLPFGLVQFIKLRELHGLSSRDLEHQTIW